MPLYPLSKRPLLCPLSVVPRVKSRDVEAEAGSGSGGSGPFFVEAEARKSHCFRFHVGGKNGEREKKLVLLSFVEERIGGAQTLRNESEEKSFREMLTST